MNIHNSNALVSITRDLAKHDYYNNGQPVSTQSMLHSNNINGLFNTNPALSINESMSRAQIFGVTDNNNQRVANTISTYMPQTPSPRYMQNTAINSLLQQPQQQQQAQTPVETFVEPVKSSPNPAEIVNKSLITPTIIPVQPSPESLLPQDAIVINRSTVLIIIVVVILAAIISMWLHQKRLEILMLNVQPRSSTYSYQPVMRQPLHAFQTPVLEVPVQPNVNTYQAPMMQVPAQTMNQSQIQPQPQTDLQKILQPQSQDVYYQQQTAMETPINQPIPVPYS